MSADTFNLKPAELPAARQGSRGSRYIATADKASEYLAAHKDVQSLEVDLGDVSLKSAAASFRNAVAKRYRDSLRVQQRGNRLYISRRD